MLKQNHLTVTQATEKLKSFCSYQDRCHADVLSKLYDLGITQSDHDEIIANLIEQDYLNEERFAKAFVRGKFNLKQWGRNKLKAELKAKKISEYCIKKAMLEIDFDKYDNTLKNLYEKKLATLKSEKNIFIRKKKLSTYLMGKGYEYSLIDELFKSEK
jgi:regulatory protein